MSTKKTRTPIESFGPELMAALLAGAKKEIRIRMPYSKAISLRRRIYQLRFRMREDNHPSYHLAARTEIKVLWGAAAGLPEPAKPNVYNTRNVARPADTNEPSIMLLRPHDHEFADSLRSAGIETELHEDPLKGLSGSPLDHLLNDADVGDDS